jgi:glutamyl-tRNA reductase
VREQTDYSRSPELIELAKNISCNFIDARTTTKNYVKTLAVKNSDKCEYQEPANKFLLSTCLRYEIYDCNNNQKYIEPFFYVRGCTCLRRLLSILVGLQSEIIGEREILIQIIQSINKSRDEENLDDSIFRGLQELISISEQIRTSCGINSEENYSTIAADLFIERLATRPYVTVAIVGGGYMADKFFSALLKAKSLKIEKIFWINRSTSRIRNHMLELADLLDFDIEVLDLDTGGHVLREVDAIFCALSNSSYYYGNAAQKDGALVVDVSYPQVFTDEKTVELVTISNTYFSQLVKNPVSRTSVALANKEIDAVVGFLESHI